VQRGLARARADDDRPSSRHRDDQKPARFAIRTAVLDRIDSRRVTRTTTLAYRSRGIIVLREMYCVIGNNRQLTVSVTSDVTIANHAGEWRLAFSPRSPSGDDR
jgi:hypothetical protein